MDESGHTGTHLFDEAQPILAYGVLSSRCNLDAVTKNQLAQLKVNLGVERLHANELKLDGLDRIAPEIFAVQRKFDLRFDLYRVFKTDYALISFFDQVFDQGLNPAVPWTGYWTPLRYVLLFKVSALFDLDLLKRAWAARIEKNNELAERELVAVCQTLRGRVSLLPDARSRTLIEDALRFVEANPAAVNYNAGDKNMLHHITPNLIGFQFVMCAVARRLKKTGARNPVVVVDQQAQFNKNQRTLAEHYVLLSKMPARVNGPGLPVIDFSGMPEEPIRFASSATSAGLELTDLYLWVFKRWLEGKDIPRGWVPIIQRQLVRGSTDEISLKALSERWTKHFEELPEPTEEQMQMGREFQAEMEERRLKAMAAAQQNTDSSSEP